MPLRSVSALSSPKSPMIHQLNPPLWLNTPKGLSLCHFMIDYGLDSDIVWVCFQHDTGECWSWENKDVRIAPNVTVGRK
jgi:hypothetical protein